MAKQGLYAIPTDEEFKVLVEESSSVCELLLKLGYRTATSGGARQNIFKRCESLGINPPIAKNTTENANKARKIPNDLYFSANTNRKGTDLRNRLVNENLKKYECECCGLGGT